MTLLYRAIYSFQGDPFQGQLSFEAGTELIVQSANENGWAYGYLVNDSSKRRQGWFPLSYVQQIGEQQTTAITPPVSPQQTASWLAPPMKHLPQTSVVVPSATPDEEDDEGFGAATPMGGEWAGSSAMSGSVFGSSSTSVATKSPTADRAQMADGPNSRISRRQQPLRCVGGALSKTASRTGSAISHAASRTGSAISDATTKTGSAARQALHEAGHRYRDMEEQRQVRMDQNACTTTTSIRSGETHQSTIATRTLASGGGILPGKCTETVTTTERTSLGGGTKTTVTTTSRPSGGVFPGIRGETTTTQTTTCDGPTGTPTSVHTTQEGRGGFFIIPLGPIGLAAAGALAVKHAVDSRNDRQNMKKQQSDDYSRKPDSTTDSR